MVDGDYLLAVQTSNSSGTAAAMTAPSGGWALLGSGGSSSVGYMKVWTKVAASEPASWDWHKDSSGCVTVLAITGFGAVDVVPAFSTATGSPTSHVAPDVSAGVVNTLLLCAFGSNGGGGSHSQPTGMTERSDVTVAGSNNHSTDTETISAAGATGTRTSTASLGANSVAMSMILSGVLADARPAVGASTAGGASRTVITRSIPTMARTAAGAATRALVARTAPVGAWSASGAATAATVRRTALAASTSAAGAAVSGIVRRGVVTTGKAAAGGASLATPRKAAPRTGLAVAGCSTLAVVRKGSVVVARSTSGAASSDVQVLVVRPTVGRTVAGGYDRATASREAKATGRALAGAAGSAVVRAGRVVVLTSAAGVLSGGLVVKTGRPVALSTAGAAARVLTGARRSAAGRSWAGAQAAALAGRDAAVAALSFGGPASSYMLVIIPWPPSAGSVVLTSGASGVTVVTGAGSARQDIVDGPSGSTHLAGGVTAGRTEVVGPSTSS
jgi:hypothetical protein